MGIFWAASNSERIKRMELLILILAVAVFGALVFFLYWFRYPIVVRGKDGKVVSVKYKDGTEWNYKDGEVVSVKYPGGTEWKYEDGKLTSVKLPGGKAIHL